MFSSQVVIDDDKEDKYNSTSDQIRAYNIISAIMILYSQEINNPDYSFHKIFPEASK